jgi:hypothetical protein
MTTMMPTTPSPSAATTGDPTSAAQPLERLLVSPPTREELAAALLRLHGVLPPPHGPQLVGPVSLDDLDDDARWMLDAILSRPATQYTAHRDSAR